MKTRPHSLDSGLKALRNFLPQIRYFTDYFHNKVTLTCLERDHWILTQEVISIFQGFPITFGTYTGGEHSYVKICEVLPTAQVIGLLPAVIKEPK